MDPENQTNLNSTGMADETNTQSGEILVNTSIPIHENIDWNVSQEQKTNSSSFTHENISSNKYDLKPKKGNRFMCFLLGILVGLLLSFGLNLPQNNHGLSDNISSTLNSLTNKMSAFGDTIGNIVIDHSKLSGTYATDNSKYKIDFNNDNTLRWRQVDEYTTLVPGETKQGNLFPELKEQTQQHESFYEGTYEYNNGEYILYVKGGYFASDTVFHATPQSDGSLRIVGGTVHNELFRKRS